MKFYAEIKVMPLRNLLDPQGKAVGNTLDGLGYNQVSNVRIGKHIQMEINAENEESAKQIADEICHKVLANQIMEYYKITIKKEEY